MDSLYLLVLVLIYNQDYDPERLAKRLNAYNLKELKADIMPTKSVSIGTLSTIIHDLRKRAYLMEPPFPKAARSFKVTDQTINFLKENNMIVNDKAQYREIL